MTALPLKIVSGGQTGVDQGALDAGRECGGWCPEGRRSEAGSIPSRFPVLGLSGSGYRERTLKNVIDSDGTVILYFAKLEGGTKITTEFCRQYHKPHVEIDRAALSLERSLSELRKFIDANDVRILNVAGTRESKWDEAHAAAHELVSALLKIK